ENEAPPAVPLDHRELMSIKVKTSLPRLSRLAQQLRRPDLNVPIGEIRVRRDGPSVKATGAAGNQTAIGGMEKNRMGFPNGKEGGFPIGIKVPKAHAVCTSRHQKPLIGAKICPCGWGLVIGA